MKTTMLTIKGRKVRAKRVYRGFIRATDWLEGSAGGSLASDNPTNFIGFRIGSAGGIPGIIVYRPIPSKPRTAKAGKREPKPKVFYAHENILSLKRGEIASFTIGRRAFYKNFVAFTIKVVRPKKFITVSYRKKK